MPQSKSASRPNLGVGKYARAPNLGLARGPRAWPPLRRRVTTAYVLRRVKYSCGSPSRPPSSSRAWWGRGRGRGRGRVGAGRGVGSSRVGCHTAMPGGHRVGQRRLPQPPRWPLKRWAAPRESTGPVFPPPLPPSQPGGPSQHAVPPCAAGSAPPRPRLRGGSCPSPRPQTPCTTRPCPRPKGTSADPTGCAPCSVAREPRAPPAQGWAGVELASACESASNARTRRLVVF